MGQRQGCGATTCSTGRAWGTVASLRGAIVFSILFFVRYGSRFVPYVVQLAGKKLRARKAV